MDYLFYSFLGGVWPLIIIGTFIYFGVKISRLNKRISILESKEFTQKSVQLDEMSVTAEANPPVMNVTSSPAPTPTQDTETQEETTARWLGWLGAVMLLLGVSFFLKYAFDHWIGPMGQVSIGIIGGLTIMSIGQKLRVKYLNYSDMLLGVGIGTLYLAIYAGYAFYHPAVIGSSVAFILMMLITTLAMVIAVVGDSIGLAVIGTLGGFLTPMLLSTGENHLVMLSLYMIILNIGVLGVSWFTKWTKLNYLAFVGTLILFSGWMSAYYWRDPDNQLTLTFFFLTIFFLIFLTNSILHHLTRKEPSAVSDLVLLALNAMWYFGVCYRILEPQHHDFLGFFALLLAVLYFAVAYVAYSSNKHDRTLNLTLPGIAVVFLSIAIPLQLTEYWISIAWLVESVVLVYVGLMIKEKPIQVFGWIVLLLGMISMMSEVGHIRNIVMNNNLVSLTPIFNMGFFLLMLGVIVFGMIAKLYAKWQQPEGEWKNIIAIFLVLGNLLMIYALTTEVSQKFNQDIVHLSNSQQHDAMRSAVYNGGVQSLNYQGQILDSASAIEVLRNKNDTTISVLWAIYATILLVTGFMRRVRVLRLFGLIFFFITAFRVLIEVGALGPLYRIISTMAFGVIAVAAAFLYAKYKHRLKEIIYD